MKKQWAGTLVGPTKDRKQNVHTGYIYVLIEFKTRPAGMHLKRESYGYVTKLVIKSLINIKENLEFVHQDFVFLLFLLVLKTV